MVRRDKQNYYLDMAQVALERSTCLRRHFGAVIVKNDVIELRTEIKKIIDEEKELKKVVKKQEIDLEVASKNAIESLTDAEALELLKKKWIDPLLKSLSKLPEILLNDLCTKVQKLSKKYETTYLDLEEEIKKTETSLASMIDDLDADEFDKKGLLELQKFLRGE